MDWYNTQKKIVLNFFHQIIGDLVSVLNPKSTTLVPVHSPQEIVEKKTRKDIFGYLYRSKELIFRPKNFFKNSLTTFGT
jgi:hypothetical protein